ncbi:Targeting protein for Xklp2-like protein [Armadillidium nasatum]|uniref:Targeting protein for Xklp2-like protein n=1 Tax=Armadillidium nasatum TaxID=96803 RepID=A0A5N5SYN2_9CRUS|nr:Targeting protein for Xklp2-like protein [Armadillidium nasatum]
MSSYNFNAPLYLNLEALDADTEDSTNSVGSDPVVPVVHMEDKENVPVLCQNSSENVVDTADPPVESMEVEENITKSKKSNKTPNKSIQGSQQPVRQSPRLASIAKSIRRANASKGLVSVQTPVEVKYHRRSLSAGANISNNFSKVKKHTVERFLLVKPLHDAQNTSSSSSGLTSDDLDTLQQTTQIRKALSNNRTRTFNIPKGPLKPTKAIEFKFATDSRVRNKSENSVEDEIMDFQRSLRSNGSVLFPPGPDNKRTRNVSGETTQPQTPNLLTRTRARSVDIPSREELEMKELEEAKKNQFKAKPLNRSILKGPEKKIEPVKKVVTVPEPFDITDTRNESLRITSNKLKKYGGSEESLLSTTSSTASWEKKRTEPKPFSFDARDTEMIRKKKEKIKMMIEEEKKLAEFHAQPMPVLDTVKGLPPKKPPTPTKVQPFNLRSDIRGTAKQQNLQTELEELERLEEQQRKFVAQPDTVLHKKPFVPEKSRKPSTTVEEFRLNTDKRAEERRSFDEHLKEKEEEMEANRKLMEERKQKEEEEEIKELRKKIVHKAQPITNYKPVVLKEGLPPTVPITPKFTIEERLKNRSLSKQALNFTADTTRSNTTNVTVGVNDVSTANVDAVNANTDSTFTMECH